MAPRPLSATAAWLALVAPFATLLLVTARGPLAGPTWSSPNTLFMVVVIATVLCAIGGLVVVAIGWRRQLAEVTLLGAALTTSSVLPLVHGLTTPGVLYGPNAATMVSAFASIPLAIVVALPVVLGDRAIARILARRWRSWTIASLVTVSIVSVALLVAPDVIPAPRLGSAVVYPFLALSLAGTGVLSLRQLRLYRIGRRRASLVASAGLMILGLSSLVWVVEQPYSIAFWGAHLIDATGVLLAVFGLAFAHLRDRSVTSSLRPIVNRDPLIALELGLTPIVHQFVAALERKDDITRDHVVRVGELAMRLGVRQRLEPEWLRALGLAALLHDVGKMLTPDEILRKPGELTQEEYEIVKEHTLHGERLLAASRLLEPASRLVRWHHERADGSGYPDGLVEAQIPLEAAIISVCDAWDAMTFTRRYRVALSFEQARQVVSEGAGTQWRADAVQLLLGELDENGPVASPRFDAVGRAAVSAGSAGGDVCEDALPVRLRSSPGAAVTSRRSS